MRSLKLSLALALMLVAVALIGGRSDAQPPVGATQVLENPAQLAETDGTVPGVTPTPSGTATAIPQQTATAEPGATRTPKPTPTGRRAYITPGYGNAAQQTTREKQDEKATACKRSNRPPTSHMLGVPGVVHSDAGGSWIPILIAVAAGAALFAAGAATLRRTGRGTPTAAGPLEGIAMLVAICGGLAGLVAQFVPAASIKERPPREVKIVVRDVKPRITRGEYLSKLRLTREEVKRGGVKTVDLQEVGSVVWLQIGLRGFKGRPLGLQYGLYDLNSREALLPGTARSIGLQTPKGDAVTLFFPAWVGYPRSTRFRAEFRLFDRDGVQQLAQTGPLGGSPFRYSCEARV